MAADYNVWKFFSDSNKVLSEYANFSSTAVKDFSRVLDATKKFEAASKLLVETYTKLGLIKPKI